MTEKAVMFWSGGKNSVLALQRVKEQGKLDVVCLVIASGAWTSRVCVHGVRNSLISAQAEAMGIPTRFIKTETICTDTYSVQVREVLKEFADVDGVTKVVYGDQEHGERRAWRDIGLGELGMEGVYPLWEESSFKLAHDFIDRGNKAVLCCVNEAYIPGSLVGMAYNEDFLLFIPSRVDPMGYRGEFHTFVHIATGLFDVGSVEWGATVYKRIKFPNYKPTGYERPSYIVENDEIDFSFLDLKQQHEAW